MSGDKGGLERDGSKIEAREMEAVSVLLLLSLACGRPLGGVGSAGEKGGRLDCFVGMPVKRRFLKASTSMVCRGRVGFVRDSDCFGLSSRLAKRERVL